MSILSWLYAAAFLLLLTMNPTIPEIPAIQEVRIDIEELLPELDLSRFYLFINSLEGKPGSRTFRAVSTPATGILSALNIPV